MDTAIKRLEDVDHHLVILERTFRNAFNSFDEAILDDALQSLPEYVALKKNIEAIRKNIEIETGVIDTDKLENMYGKCAERLMNIINIPSVRQKFIVILNALSAPTADDGADERLLSLKERAAFLRTVAEKNRYELDTLPKLKSVVLLLQDLEKIKKLSVVVCDLDYYDQKFEKDIAFYEVKIASFTEQLKRVYREIEQKQVAKEKATYLAELEKKSPLVFSDDSLGVYRIQSGENVADILYGEAACVPLPAIYEVENYMWARVASSMINLLEADPMLALRIGFKKGVHNTTKTKISLDRLNDLAMYIMAKEKKIVLSKKVVLLLEEILFDK